MRLFEVVQIMEEVQAVLTDDLRPEYASDPSRNHYTGHCYAASEALYHLLGGKKVGLKPMNMRVDGVSHWFLRADNGMIIDPTALQFDPPGLDYSPAKGRGFLTRHPSKRATEIIRRVCANRAIAEIAEVS